MQCPLYIPFSASLLVSYSYTLEANPEDLSSYLAPSRRALCDNGTISYSSTDYFVRLLLSVDICMIHSFSFFIFSLLIA